MQDGVFCVDFQENRPDLWLLPLSPIFPLESFPEITPTQQSDAFREVASTETVAQEISRNACRNVPSRFSEFNYSA
jgi:hypothetical protein